MIPRFVIAKFVPDLNRMEPRNVGVFLWANGELRAKFLELEEVDFVDNKELYSWWIATWQETISGKVIKPIRGASISKRESNCIKALLSHQEDNYLLVDAGELLEPIKNTEIQDALDFLYSDLVSKSKSVIPPSKANARLSQQCKGIFAKLGFLDRPDYHEGYRLECPTYGVRKRFRFSYAFGNGEPDSILQIAALRSEISVNSAALKLHAITENAILNRNKCAAIVRKDDIESATHEEAYDFLRNICNVISIDQPEAAEKIESLVNGSQQSTVGTEPSNSI